MVNGSVTVGVMRKYSVAQYETLDVTISVTDSAEPEESQEQITDRLFEQLKKDAVKICGDFFTMTQGPHKEM
jgi:hypothetical protein